MALLEQCASDEAESTIYDVHARGERFGMAGNLILSVALETEGIPVAADAAEVTSGSLETSYRSE